MNSRRRYQSLPTRSLPSTNATVSANCCAKRESEFAKRVTGHSTGKKTATSAVAIRVKSEAAQRFTAGPAQRPSALRSLARARATHLYQRNMAGPHEGSSYSWRCSAHAGRHQRPAVHSLACSKIGRRPSPRRSPRCTSDTSYASPRGLAAYAFAKRASGHSVGQKNATTVGAISVKSGIAQRLIAGPVQKPSAPRNWTNRPARSPSGSN